MNPMYAVVDKRGAFGLFGGTLVSPPFDTRAEALRFQLARGLRASTVIELI